MTSPTTSLALGDSCDYPRSSGGTVILKGLKSRCGHAEILGSPESPSPLGTIAQPSVNEQAKYILREARTI